MTSSGQRPAFHELSGALHNLGFNPSNLLNPLSKPGQHVPARSRILLSFSMQFASSLLVLNPFMCVQAEAGGREDQAGAGGGRIRGSQTAHGSLQEEGQEPAQGRQGDSLFQILASHCKLPMGAVPLLVIIAMPTVWEACLFCAAPGHGFVGAAITTMLGSGPRIMHVLVPRARLRALECEDAMP